MTRRGLFGGLLASALAFILPRKSKAEEGELHGRFLGDLQKGEVGYRFLKESLGEITVLRTAQPGSLNLWASEKTTVASHGPEDQSPYYYEGWAYTTVVVYPTPEEALKAYKRNLNAIFKTCIDRWDTVDGRYEQTVFRCPKPSWLK